MEFLNFSISKKLKEKGYRELCLAYYTNDDTLYYNYSHKAGANYKDCYLSHNLMPKDSVSGKFIDAPTISQILKWLREEKKIHLIVEIADSGWYYTLYPNFRWENCKLKSDTYIMSFNHKESFEQAALAGIEYVLDNLI